MRTPICDYVKKYASGNPTRLHMPGHKGANLILGVEKYDVTEIDGADELYHAKGIILESEKNASSLFDAHTFYSTEGSSLSIRAMLFLAVKYALTKKIKPIIAAARNAHKVFLSAATLLDFDVKWLCSDENSNYLTCNITADYLDKFLSNAKEKPCAVYLTTPDYLGNIADVKGLKRICKKHGVLLLVDNAHGAYLNFLSPSIHPINQGADMCCDSAHKTLPCVTGGAYLHISKTADSFFKNNAKDALSLFGTTSPSYLILQSLDATNAYIADGYQEKLSQTAKDVAKLKNKLADNGYNIIGSEPLKITLNTKEYGYCGSSFNSILSSQNIIAEFYDEDFIVFMLTPENSKSDLKKLESALLSIKKLPSIDQKPPRFYLPKRALSVRQAVLSPSITIPLNDALGKILSEITIACPPAVPLIVSGEVIDENVIARLNYYGVKSCKVVK